MMDSMQGTIEISTNSEKLVMGLNVVHYTYPILLLAFFLTAFTVRSIWTSDKSRGVGSSADPSDHHHAHGASQNGDAHPAILGPGGKPLPQKLPPRDLKSSSSLDFSRPRKLFFNWTTALIAATFVASAAIVILHALVARKEGWWCGKSTVIYIVGSFFVWSLILISLVDSAPSPHAAHLATWILALFTEGTIMGLSIRLYTHKHREPSSGPGKGKLRKRMTDWEAVEVFVLAVRLFLIFLLIALYLLFVAQRSAKLRAAKRAAAAGQAAEETTPLLGAENGHANGHGTNGTANPVRPKTPAPPGWERPTTVPSRSWWEYVRSYAAFFPYLWPTKDRRLQVLLVICFAIVLAQRGINLLVPYQMGRITNILSGEDGPLRMPWVEICLYILYKLLQGGNGILGAIRGNLWIPVSQYSYRELSVAAFEHVHGLSLEFHLSKKTGEVLSALGKGNSINSFLEQLTFNMVPMVVDLIVAIGYFLINFDAYYALIITIVTFWYIYLTIRMAQWRTEIRRAMVNADRDVDAVKNDSMVSYESVKYFNAEAYEFDKYREAVNRFQTHEYKVLTSLNYMNVAQNMCFMLGLLAASFLSAYQVTTGQRKVGSFVTLLTYMAQLQGPLNFFGTFYRVIQSAMINAERLLELFKEQPTVLDSSTARPIHSCEGSIRFDDVHFSYDERKPALSGLSFECQPGTTTALVGESGGGKSTVFRLLFRFYNNQRGSIQVDGHDVQDITIDSLRAQIGVVPQDTVLFNDTLMYNLRYARQAATDEEIYTACRAASIHDKILTFPDGYNTKVGERGLRLSGGEKQRIAIARTILKNPRIIMLDEATAALDTETEQHIQEAFRTLGEGRTMLVIAHRLSTITHANQILVLKDGRVVESGTHDELQALNGHYTRMWRKQIRAQKAAEEARVLKDRADRLRKDGGLDGEGSASQSEDELDARKRQYELAQAREAGTAPNEGGGPPAGHHGHGKPAGHP